MWLVARQSVLECDDVVKAFLASANTALHWYSSTTEGILAMDGIQGPGSHVLSMIPVPSPTCVFNF